MTPSRASTRLRGRCATISGSESRRTAGDRAHQPFGRAHSRNPAPRAVKAASAVVCQGEPSVCMEESSNPMGLFLSKGNGARPEQLYTEAIAVCGPALRRLVIGYERDRGSDLLPGCSARGIEVALHRWVWRSASAGMRSSTKGDARNGSWRGLNERRSGKGHRYRPHTRHMGRVTR